MMADVGDVEWSEVPLFGPQELAELRRIAEAEAARERARRERDRIRRAGEKLARDSRREQGLSEYVEVELWEK